MELLIFSDSHGRADAMRRAMKLQVSDVHAVCFLGDGLFDAEALDTGRAMLWAVRGNCDWGASWSEYPTERLIDLAGHRLLLTHGHTFGVKSGCGALLSHAAQVGADIVLFGHTHEPVSLCVDAGETVGGCTLERPMYLFNPGSVGQGGSFGTLCLSESTVLLSHGRLRYER
ncbi:MAG: YfcE family phosphodiesterase [Ruminococcaceae bacterium]|nr:YfcE family phosphodiesterase [Oscillospiraceae bacterium]